MRFSEMERKHQCITCGKQYKQKSSLNKHKTYECGKTPGFQCSLCPFKTFQKSNLNGHIARIHWPQQ